MQKNISSALLYFRSKEIMWLMKNSIDWCERIAKHNFEIVGPLTHPFESVHIGNGDIGASINVYSHEIRITLGKSDVWDARYDGRPEEAVLKHDDLIQMMKEKNRDLHSLYLEELETQRSANETDYLFESPAYNRPPYLGSPMPKRAGCIRLYHPGLSNTLVTSSLRLSDGIFESRFSFASGTLLVRTFVERNHNRVWLEVESDGETPWFALIVEKEPDDADATMPLPVIDFENNNWTIGQCIPAGFGIDEFNWFLAPVFPQKGSDIDTHNVEQHAWRLRQYCSLEAGAKTALCVGVATSRDGHGDAREHAIELSMPAEPFNMILESHQNEWANYWNRSSIMLDDEALESAWYRNHFGYGCAMKRGTTPPGSGGNVVMRDSVPWHGDCHMNHNFQKWFCTALPTNQPEWIDVFADFIEDKMPIFEYQAELIFGLEGAYCDLLYFPIMSKEHCHINNLMGRSLALTGWVGQPLWWHWEYMRDKQWLETRAYPYLKKSAQFYYNYMQKYMDDSGDIYPSIRIEEPDWSKDFIGNRNVISDLCMFKKAFDRAISAAEVLGVDEDWQEKWKTMRALVPAIDHDFDENGNGWVALDKYWRQLETNERVDKARHIRWAGGGWIVYPGEYVPGDGDDSLTCALRDMIQKTDLMDPFTSEITGENLYPGVPIIHPISSIIPAIRLGIHEHFDSIRNVILAHRLTYGQTSSYMLSDGDMPKEINGYGGYLWYDWRSVENKYLGVLATTEMLIQSQGGVIRLFPFWPEEKSASFTGLRAIGGFVVSASCKDNILEASFFSEAGVQAHLSWKDKPSVTCDGTLIEVSYSEGIATFETQANKTYVVTNP